MTAEEFSLQTLGPKSPSGLESVEKETLRTKQQVRPVSHPRIEAQGSQSSQRLSDTICCRGGTPTASMAKPCSTVARIFGR